MQSMPSKNNWFDIYSLSEKAITIEFGGNISEDLLQKITSFNQLVHQYPFAGFCTTVPAYTTLSIFFDPIKVSQSELFGATCFEKVSNYVNELKNKEGNTIVLIANKITIPVCYDDIFGPDIQEVASLNRLTIEEVIHLHSSALYKVYMIGFIPGFAYLGGMDAQLNTPRKATPRKAVPSGAVGIAGQQTGIYPLETPGGWQIIGQTPLKLFDANRMQPSLLKAGDQVVFKSIDLQEFRHLSNN
jgi:inhibitor of KinA